MTSFNFDYKHYDIGKQLRFAIDGNYNLYINPLSEYAINATEQFIPITDDDAYHMSSYLVSNGLGTNCYVPSGNNKTVVKSSKPIMIAYSHYTDLYNSGMRQRESTVTLPEANAFTIILGEFAHTKMTFSVETRTRKYSPVQSFPAYNDTYKALSLQIIGLPIPQEGIKLPKIITDKFVDWLGFWYQNHAVATRISELIDGRYIKPFPKFKGHHKLCDINLTKDTVTGKDILVLMYQNMMKACVIRFDMYVADIYEQDMVTNQATWLSDVRNVEKLVNTIHSSSGSVKGVGRILPKPYNLAAIEDCSRLALNLVRLERMNNERIAVFGK